MSPSEFITAAFSGDLSKVRALVADADDLALKTALANAAQQGHAEVVELLLAKGPDINASTRDGYTPLTMACRGDHWDVARMLIANGADVNIATGNGYTALIFAAAEGKLEIVEALIAKGANVNATTVVGTTALLLGSTHKDVVEALIKAGAGATPPLDSSPSSSTSITPGELSKSQEVIEALLKATSLLNQGQAFEAAKHVVNLEPALVDLELAVDSTQLTALKKGAAIALANFAVAFSNKCLGQVNDEMSRHGWDSGYNLGEAQSRARGLKFKTIAWLKIASALDPSNLDISKLIDSFFNIHVTSVYDKELCKR